MKISELRELSNEELHQKYEDIQEELFNLRFQKSKNTLENPGQIRILKKDIAKINTLLTERKLKR